MEEAFATNPPAIIVVEDDEDIRGLIIGQLARENYHLRAAADIASLRGLCAGEQPDLIILDLNLPDGDGLSFCRELRGQGIATPIIMVTARGAAIDRVLGLELGADDYLTKPFEPRELLARVRNILRRSRGGGTEPSAQRRVIRFGPWRLDLIHRRLIAPDDSLVMLSSAEFRLLGRFTEEPNKVLSREELLPERRATVAFDRSIDLQVSRLRQKLAAIPGGDAVILTVRSEGYVLACAVEEA